MINFSAISRNSFIFIMIVPLLGCLQTENSKISKMHNPIIVAEKTFGNERTIIYQTSAIVTQARSELENIQQVVPNFRIIKIKRSRENIALTTRDSLTVEHIRNIEIDPNPPALTKRTRAYEAQQVDDCPMNQKPYVAKGIRPFRFRYFQCEFNYGGLHNYEMQDYAVTHGFNIVFPYMRKLEETKHWPKKTMLLNWGVFIDWQKWLAEHGIQDSRYDKLSGSNLTEKLISEGRFRRDLHSKEAKQHSDLLMIDQEHEVLSLKKLRLQSWYPHDEPVKERTAFETNYYNGFAQTHISSVRAARQSGWKNISIYGWEPAERTWGGLVAEEALGADNTWHLFGDQILEEVDVVNHSVYCFFWSPKNVAYTLANIDRNLNLVSSATHPKPVRTYYWTLLHGGGIDQYLWLEQPLPNEDIRAMIAMGFFTGFDGFDNWNWSGTDNHHIVTFHKEVKNTENILASKNNSRRKYKDVMVGRYFQMKDENNVEENFYRYDLLHIVSVDDAYNTVRFQKIRPSAKNLGIGEQYPYYEMSQAYLLPYLRPKSEPVAAMIEGMALVKPFEYLLRHGEVKIDVSAQDQFRKDLPIVRRVKIGPYHIIITYDPKVVQGGQPRIIVLRDFDGVNDLKLTLPADSETRIFVLEENL